MVTARSFDEGFALGLAKQICFWLRLVVLMKALPCFFVMSFAGQGPICEYRRGSDHSFRGQTVDSCL